MWFIVEESCNLGQQISTS